MMITLGWSLLVARVHSRRWKVEVDNMRTGVSVAIENTTRFKIEWVIPLWFPCLWS